MSLPVIVDIAIGLVFIYLLLSLLASEIQELIATLLQWRAKHLKDSITNLFASDAHSHHSVEKAHQLARQVYQHPLIRGINQESRGFFPNLFRGVTWLISRIYRAIAGKPEGEFGDRRTAPSYIPREAFATALLEQLGTKYFVERLVEAKFAEFVAAILDRVSADEAIKTRAGYKKLQKSLHRIEQEFISNRIDLNSAVQSIIGKLDVFLEDMADQLAIDDLEELKDWKKRVFVDDVERIIDNAGLNPTLQEIVDSIDKNSKTHRTYKDRFRRYEQERFQEVRRDLKYFEDILLVFLRGILQTEGLQGGVRAASPSAEMPIPGGASPLEAAKAAILAQLEQLDELFFRDGSADTPEAARGGQIQRTKMPMAHLDRVVLENLVQLENSLAPGSGNGATKRLRHSIHAFREGFAGTNYLSDLSYLPLFKEVILSQIFPFVLLFGLGVGLAVGLSDLAIPDQTLLNQTNEIGQWGQLGLSFRDVLIGRWGGLVAVACLGLIPFAWYTGSRVHFARQRQRNCSRERCDSLSVTLQAAAACKTLAEIFDDYSADQTPPALHEPLLASSDRAQEKSRQEFSEAIAARLARLSDEPRAVLYNEVKDLGRSFRRYYLRFILENADVDLPFIPNSVKQSLAVLIRRSKTSAKQAEDQIIHLKAEVEAWYDRSMERASGVYRRNAKGISILIGVVLAIAVNANSIHILDQLAFEEELRLTLTETVQQSIQANSGAEDKSVEELLDDYRETITPTLDEINLPIGWDPHLINEEFGCNLPRQATDDSAGNAPHDQLWHQLIQHCIYGPASTTSEYADGSASPKAFFYPTAIASIFLRQPLVGLRYLLGWIITGIAISMGASFWFDLLGKLVKVRNTGKPIPTSSEAASGQDVSAAASLKDQ
jgi:hypothetical protein